MCQKNINFFFTAILFSFAVVFAVGSVVIFLFPTNFYPDKIVNVYNVAERQYIFNLRCDCTNDYNLFRYCSVSSFLSMTPGTIVSCILTPYVQVHMDCLTEYLERNYPKKLDLGWNRIAMSFFSCVILTFMFMILGIIVWCKSGCCKKRNLQTKDGITLRLDKEENSQYVTI
jgi:hypothetical protein